MQDFELTVLQVIAVMLIVVRVDFRASNILRDMAVNLGKRQETHFQHGQITHHMASSGYDPAEGALHTFCF